MIFFIKTKEKLEALERFVELGKRSERNRSSRRLEEQIFLYDAAENNWILNRLRKLLKTEIKNYFTSQEPQLKVLMNIKQKKELSSIDFIKHSVHMVGKKV